MKTKWKHAIVIGASSGIGEALVYELARRGVSVALVARREAELVRVKGEGEKVKGDTGTSPQFPIFVHDVTDFSDVPELFQRITQELGGCDLVIYNSGVMPHIAPDEFNFTKDKLVIDVNVLGAFAWLNEAAMRFKNVGSGNIVGISSIAGERGRRGNPAYITSKAALSTYLESLRNRLSQYGVRITTIKPGFIDTDMIKGLPNVMGAIPATEAARQICNAAAKGAVVKYVPGKWRIVSMILHMIPSFIFRRLNF